MASRGSSLPERLKCLLCARTTTPTTGTTKRAADAPPPDSRVHLQGPVAHVLRPRPPQPEVAQVGPREGPRDQGRPQDALPPAPRSQEPADGPHRPQAPPLAPTRHEKS